MKRPEFSAAKFDTHPTMSAEKLREMMEEEDERIRASIKDAAYNCEEGTFQDTVELLLAMSKQRQREIFALYWRPSTGSSLSS